MDYSIHGKLNIRTDLELKIPKYFKKSFSRKPDLQILKGRSDISEIDHVFPPYIYHRKDLLLHKYGFITPCELTLGDLEGNTTIKFTETYRSLVGIRGVIDSVIDFKLLQEGMIKMHGSCVHIPDKGGVMVVGWDHSGKSTLALNMVNEGANFLSDDITILTKDFAYSYPKDVKIFTGMHFLAKKLNSVPFVNRTLGLNKGVPPKNVTDKTKVRYVFISRYGEKSIRKVELKEAARTMEILNIYVTAPFDKRHLVLEYCHYNKYDLGTLLRKRYNIIKKFLKRVECFELTSTNTKDSNDLIKKTIG